VSRRIVVVSGGLSVPSSTRLLADRISDAVTTQVSARGEQAEVAVVELRELATDLAVSMTTGGLPTPALHAATELLASADGVVAVTPVFAASYSGLFKSFIDVLDPELLTGVPVLIAATAGTARHSLVLDHAMRPLFSHLHAVVVPTGVFAATDDFGGPGSDELTGRIGRAASELAALVVADRQGVDGFAPAAADHDRRSRRASALSSPTVVTPFEQLLQGHGG
jgi:FMN reductase